MYTMDSTYSIADMHTRVMSRLFAEALLVVEALHGTRCWRTAHVGGSQWRGGVCDAVKRFELYDISQQPGVKLKCGWKQSAGLPPDLQHETLPLSEKNLVSAIKGQLGRKEESLCDDIRICAGKILASRQAGSC